MRRTLIALLLLASPLLAQAPNGWAPIENGWAEIQTTAPTGTVTTTGTLASGQVALGSGATSITGDAGATHAGSAGTMKFTIGGITFGGSAAGGTGLYLSAANTLGFTTNGTERWVMNASGALNPTIDATYDIGTSLVRPRDITISRTGTFGTSVDTPLVTGSLGITLSSFGGVHAAKIDNNGFYPLSDNLQPFGYPTLRWSIGYFGTSVITRSVQFTTGSRPTCDAAARGTQWYVAGGAGAADTIEVCGKSAADSYSWIALATF